ncbi:hypothetical protein B0T24DRAFT_595596 [Lasiosphaeria ovina]|uniref:Uncharacterized protein n=1 Tax=Lasiosphaeria ovina TaxID=92902 RepID=A0AAE0K832_9PEZI|nr:hypothetical protein B0T24DRAFT_595596 [Lasiosphaeria ovina]
MIFIAAVAFGIIQCVEGALQVYISFKVLQQGEKQLIADNGIYPSCSGTAVQGHPSALRREELTPYGNDKGDIGQDARAESAIADMEPVELYASTAQCSTPPAAAPANSNVMNWLWPAATRACTAAAARKRTPMVAPGSSQPSSTPNRPYV